MSSAPQNGYFLDTEDNQRNLVEKVTGSMKATESDHTLNHVGLGFKAHLQYAGSLVSNASVSWCFTGPTDRFAHIKNIIVTALGSSAKVEFIKDKLLQSQRGQIFIAEHLFGKPKETIDQNVSINSFELKDVIKFKE